MSALYTMTIGQPRWARWRPLAWLARVLRADRGWAAHGATQAEFESDLVRLTRAQGLDLVWSEGAATITTAEGQATVIASGYLRTEGD